MRSEKISWFVYVSSYPPISLTFCLCRFVHQTSSTYEIVPPTACFVQYVNFYPSEGRCILTLTSDSSNFLILIVYGEECMTPMKNSVLARGHLYWARFCWRFLPIKWEFILYCHYAWLVWGITLKITVHPIVYCRFMLVQEGCIIQVNDSM